MMVIQYPRPALEYKSVATVDSKTMSWARDGGWDEATCDKHLAATSVSAKAKLECGSSRKHTGKWDKWSLHPSIDK